MFNFSLHKLHSPKGGPQSQISHFKKTIFGQAKIKKRSVALFTPGHDATNKSESINPKYTNDPNPNLYGSVRLDINFH